MVQARKSASLLFESSELSLISVKLAGEGNTHDKTAKCLVGSRLSARMRYESHRIQNDGEVEKLEIQSRDAVTKTLVTVCLSIYGAIPALRSSATITNESEDTDITVTQLSSIAVGGLTTNSPQWYHDYTLWTSTNTWFREAQWRKQTLPEIGIDNDGICELPDGHLGSQAAFTLQNHGSFSTNGHLSMGALVSKDNNDTWLWQVENNGSWRWEIGDYKDSIYLAAGGPTGMDHDWKQVLRPGQSFTTVPVALAHVDGGLESAFAALTDYRRQIRRPHKDNENLPIIFNDYMNCLMGDPDEDKVAALIDPVAKTGAEYFVIDAGWYADDGIWWDDVGLWEPSKKRFPSGFKVLLDKIRGKGLIPGLWIEPEVVGVRSVVANRLPKDAFFQECGQRVVEKGRFQLDYRHPEVRAWIDKIIYNLVVNYGVGYLKFDYNIEVTQGTDVGGSSSAGSAHLEHQRAYLVWVRSLLDRYPTLVIENCSSGGQRMEYAMLSVHSLQSTSDQQNPALYAAIAAALPTAVAPEQSATWAYPQPEWSDELNAFTVVNSLLGRVHLSGRLDKLSPGQLRLVIEGMDVYKIIRSHLNSAHPIWPLGLPQWHDDWVSLALVTKKNGIYLAVWRRGGVTEKDLPVKLPDGQTATTAKVLYPTCFSTDATWNKTSAILRLKLPDTVCARLLHIL
ncbi:Aldolase-type TIM barrel [Penicillium vulpinum]|nr:Aldolase-type TIM barrel [Penicillium vulpinum]KAJ5951054.1 Aldolase-type TIM barrel [Penicillium vulpinum]